MIPAIAWLEHAACAGMDDRVFFATSRHAREQVKAARKVCNACPVKEQCAAWAIKTGEKWGVWGGMSQKELREQRRRFTDRWRSGTRSAG